MRIRRLCAVVVLVCLSALVLAQETKVSPDAQAPPRLVKISSTLPDQQGTVGVTFALYKDQNSGVPLWLETQNVSVDANGRFTVMLGANHAEGVPTELFAAGEARWLGIQVTGQAEMPRTLLVSVPYALKSADADRLGGLPLSAFVLNPKYKADANDILAATASSYLNAGAVAQASSAISGATVGNLPMFTSTAGDMTSSGVFQNTNGTIGINTANPASMFHVVSPLPGVATFQRQGGARFTFQNYTDAEGLGTIFYVTDSAGANYKPLSFDASSLRFRANGSDTNVLFVDGAGRIGMGTTAPAARLEVNGDIKLSSSSGGKLIFPDNTFLTSANAVGGGGVSSVTAAGGSGLAASPATGAVVVSSDFSVLQKRVGTGCASGSAIASINADGSVNCQTVSGGGSISLPVNWSGTSTAPAGVVNVTTTSNGPPDTNNGPPDPNTLPAAIVGLAPGTGIAVGVVGKATGPDGVGVIGISTQSQAPAVVAWSQATGLSKDATALNAMLANEGGKVIEAESSAISGQVTAFRGKLASPNATGLQLDFVVPPAWMINAGGGAFTVDGTGSVSSTGLHLTNGGAMTFSDGTRQTTAATSGASYTAGSGLSLVGNQFSNTGVLTIGANAPLSSSGGQNPTIALSGTVLTANGGTGLSSSGAAGQYLRSNGSTWTASALQASDLPSLSGNYVDLSSAQVIAGAKTFSSIINGSITGNAATVTNGVTTTGAYANPAWLTSLDGGKIIGTVGKSALPAASVFADQANTFTAGKQDFSTAAATLPVKAVLSGAAPSSCVANKEMVIQTDAAPAGQQLFLCNGTGTGWNLVGGNGTYTAGAGLNLASNQFSVNFAGNGAATSAARSDHNHDGNYLKLSGGTLTGAVSFPAGQTFPAANISGQITDAQIAGVSGAKVTGNISGSAATFTGSLAGDVSGTQASTVVTKLQGLAVSATVPSTGQALKWNGTQWAPAADANSGGTVTSVSSGTGISVTNPTTTPTVSLDTTFTDGRYLRSVTGAAGGDLSGVYPNPIVTKLQGQPVSSAAPVAGQILKWNGSAWTPSVDVTNPGTVTNVIAGSGVTVTNGTTTPTVSLDTTYTDAQYLKAAGGTVTGQVGIGAAPAASNLLDVNGTASENSWWANVMHVGGTAQSSAAGQAYLTGLNVNPTYNIASGYANYLAGILTSLDASQVTGSNVAHSVVGYMLGSQPTSGAECSVGFGISVPNQQTSLCNGVYGFYQGGAAQYNYFGSKVGIGTPFPTQPLTVQGNMQIAGTGNKLFFPDGTFIGSATGLGSTYSAGSGLTLASNTFSVNFAGNGSATTAAHSDHNHDASYLGLGGGTLTGGLNITNGQVGIGAAPQAYTLADINGTITTPTPTSYGAHLLTLDGTTKSSNYGQAYLKGLYIAPTFDVTAGYANYLEGEEIYMGTKVGNNVAHSVVGYHLNGQPTSGLECSVGFGISVPNQQTNLCNGKYGFYQGDAATQYNYFASSVGIGTPFPAQALHVKGNVQVDGNLIVAGSATQALNLTSGAGQPVSLAVGSGSGSGAAATVAAGNAGSASGGTGGNLNLTAGNAMAQGGAGWTGAGPGGAVNITAGAGYNTVGGNVVITSGSTSTWALSATYSKVSLKGGIANTGDGATIDVEGGHTTGSPGGPAPSIGGNVVIKAGAGNGGTSTLAGGNIILQAGTGSPNGNVQIQADTQVTGNLTTSGTGAMPVYSSAGVAQAAAHMVTGTINFAGGSIPVSLSGAAAFSSAASYVCTVTGSAVQPFAVTNGSGSSFTISGPADPALKYICVGN